MGDLQLIKELLEIVKSHGKLFEEQHKIILELGETVTFLCKTLKSVNERLTLLEGKK